MDPIRPALPRTDSCEGPSGGPPPLASSDAERAARGVTQAQYDAFASGEVTDPHSPCHDFSDGEVHDFDHCVTDSVPDPVLFSKEAGDAHDVAATDVRQNRIGDCSLMASLVALTGTAEGRALIKEAIVENKDDQGKVISYTVTLHKRESHWFRATTFSDIRVTVDPLLAFGHAELRNEGGTTEVWPAVIEKAYAQYVGGYNRLNRGSTADIPMELLTGKPAKSFAPADYSAEQLKSDLAADKLILLESKASFKPKRFANIEYLHAYTVMGTEMRDSQLYVTLRNPWGPGKSQPLPLLYSDLGRWFSRVDVGSVR